MSTNFGEETNILNSRNYTQAAGFFCDLFTSLVIVVTAAGQIVVKLKGIYRVSH
jgi:hypothetical protein